MILSDRMMHIICEVDAMQSCSAGPQESGIISLLELVLRYPQDECGVANRVLRKS